MSLKGIIGLRSRIRTRNKFEKNHVMQIISRDAFFTQFSRSGFVLQIEWAMNSLTLNFFEIHHFLLNQRKGFREVCKNYLHIFV